MRHAAELVLTLVDNMLHTSSQNASYAQLQTVLPYRKTCPRRHTLRWQQDERRSNGDGVADSRSNTARGSGDKVSPCFSCWRTLCAHACVQIQIGLRVDRDKTCLLGASPAVA